jgi:hypothetical protein
VVPEAAAMHPMLKEPAEERVGTTTMTTNRSFESAEPEAHRRHRPVV